MPAPFEALKNAADTLVFWGNDVPKCPHCGHDCNICDDYELHEEGDHDLECPKCEGSFRVSTRISFSYSTNNQGDV